MVFRNFKNTQCLKLESHGKNIFRLFDVLALFPFSKSETELDYFQQTLYIRVSERLKSQDIRKSGKSLKYLELMTSIQPTAQEANLDNCARKLKKVSCKTFHRRIYLTLLREFLYKALPGIFPKCLKHL